MRGMWIALALVLGSWTIAAVAQESSMSRNNPTLPPNVREDAATASREAIRKFIQAQCDTYHAMASYDVSSNELIDRASENFAAAANSFGEAAKLLVGEGGDLPAPPEEADGLAEVLAVLSSQGYDAPRTYDEALSILSDASARAAAQVRELRYDSTPGRNRRVLTNLRDASGRAAETFVAISALTNGPAQL